MKQFSESWLTPAGWMEVLACEDAILRLEFRENPGISQNPSSVTETCRIQMQEYFDRKRSTFSLPIAPEGTRFQQEVWLALQQIPFGKTISYLELALQLGDRRKIRAAGTANGRNPIAIVIPCHRVIGSNGSLVGYGGGLWRKKLLLEHESATRQRSIF